MSVFDLSTILSLSHQSTAYHRRLPRSVLSFALPSPPSWPICLRMAIRLHLADYLFFRQISRPCRRGTGPTAFAQPRPNSCQHVRPSIS